MIDPADPGDAVLAFLAERHLASLTTMRADGSPHPVGHELRNPALAGVLRAEARVFVMDLLGEVRFLLGTEQTAHDRYGAAGIEHVNHRLRIAGSNLHRRVGFARGCAADEQRQGHRVR